MASRIIFLPFLEVQILSAVFAKIKDTPPVRSLHSERPSYSLKFLQSYNDAKKGFIGGVLWTRSPFE